MNWNLAAGVCAVVTTGVAVLNAYITATLRQYIAECREQDKKEMREWINGSFMRSAVVEEKIVNLKERVNELRRPARVA